MRIEFIPDLHPNLKWNVQICLRIPPSAPSIIPVGTAAIYRAGKQILFFVSISLYFKNIFRNTTNLLF